MHMQTGLCAQFGESDMVITMRLQACTDATNQQIELQSNCNGSVCVSYEQDSGFSAECPVSGEGKCRAGIIHNFDIDSASRTRVSLCDKGLAYDPTANKVFNITYWFINIFN